MKRHWLKCSIVLWICLSGALTARAQTWDGWESTGEVSGYGGVGFAGLGTHGWVGGTVGESTSKYFMGSIDTSFMPLGTRTLRDLPLVTTTSRLYDFNFTFHVQIPIHRRWTPYGIAGAALLFNTYDVHRFRPDGVIFTDGRSDAKFGFETGGGARYFVRNDWGIKGEYRYTISTRNFSRILIGVFYQFDGSWPFLPHGNSRRMPSVSR
jgi:opacity protein-like surface antigen